MSGKSGGSVREMGPLISGKSRLVKYYNLARSEHPQSLLGHVYQAIAALASVPESYVQDRYGISDTMTGLEI